MTDEQKARFCDGFCKYRAFYDEQLKELGKAINEVQNSQLLYYVDLVNEKREALLEYCDNCPLSEV